MSDDIFTKYAAQRGFYKYALVLGVTVDWRVMIIGGNLDVRNYCNRRKAVQGS